MANICTTGCPKGPHDHLAPPAPWEPEDFLTSLEARTFMSAEEKYQAAVDYARGCETESDWRGKRIDELSSQLARAEARIVFLRRFENGTQLAYQLTLEAMLEVASKTLRDLADMDDDGSPRLMMIAGEAKRTLKAMREIGGVN